MWVILSAKPSCSIAAAESPPPIIEIAPDSAPLLQLPLYRWQSWRTQIRHRTVPYHGFGILDCLRIQLDCFLTDVHTHPSVRNLVRRNSLAFCIIAELLPTTLSTGSKSFTPFFSALSIRLFASSTLSSSHRDVPMLYPFALKKVYAYLRRL